MLKKLSSILLLILLNTIANAQNIKGKVVDSLAKSAIEYASIGIYSSSDNKLVSGAVTDANGAFNINNLKANTYNLKIDFIGYQTKLIKNINLNSVKSIDLGSILLIGSAQMLNEITVTGEKPNAINKIDKQVYKASQFESAKGGTAIDVIRNMPSITVNGENEIRLRGSTGFLILLNGKPVQTDAATLLKSADKLMYQVKQQGKSQYRFSR